MKGFHKRFLSFLEKSLIHVDIELHNVFEYEEVNGIPGFQGNDTISSSINFKNTSAGTVNCTAASDGFTCSVSAGNGALVVDVFIAAKRSNFSGSIQDPSTVKFSVTFNYPNKVNGTFIGLEVRTRVLALHRFLPDLDNSTRQRLVKFGPGSFSWVEQAISRGENVSVVLSKVVENVVDDTRDNDDDDDKEDNACHAFFISFLSADTGSIFWDPTLGVSVSALQGEESASSTLYTLWGMAFAVIVLLVF